MSENEVQKEWLELCDYVHRSIMGYTVDMKFPRFIALRLRGLSSGQFIANKKQKPQANYDYKTILYTFKACKLDILKAFRNNQTKWKDEKHKFNYAMVIVENNINDIVIRLKNAEVAKEKTEKLNLENIGYDGAEYKKKSKKTSDKLQDLW